MVISEMEIRLRADIARLQRDMDSARQVVGNATAGMERAANAAKMAIASIGAGLGLQQLAGMVDQYAKFTAQLRLASQSQREYGASYADVKRIATQATQGLQETGMLYARIANGTRELGVAQKQVAAITETVNLALLVSGATASESASAQLQLSQAFASGTLRGEEFNAVNEAAPRLMLALADGIGVPVGALKKMAEEGKITSKIMSDVLPKALGTLRNEAKEVQTIAGAFTVLRNEMMEFVGIQAQANGVVAATAGGLTLLAKNLGLVAGAVAVIAGARLIDWLSGVVGSTLNAAAANRAFVASNLEVARAEAIASAQASLLTNERLAEVRASTLAASGNVQLALTTNGLIPAQAGAAAAAAVHEVNMTRLTVAQRAASISTAALAGGAKALSGVLALTGGPIGLLITVLGGAALAWSHYGNKAKEANDKAKSETEKSTQEIIDGLNKQNDKIRERIELSKQAGMKDAAQQGGEEVDRQAALLKQILTLQDSINRGTAGENGSLRLIELQYQYTDLANAMDKVAGSKKELQSGTDADKRSDWMAKNTQYLDKAGKVAAAITAAKKDLGTAFNSDIESSIRASFDKQDVSKAASAYTTLITSIREKITASEQERAAGIDLSESQKLQIKLDKELETGKLKLTPARQAVVQGLLSELAASEQLSKAQQAEKDGMTWMRESAQARNASTAALATEYAMYGKTADARDIAMLAVKGEADLEKFLTEERRKGIEIGEELEAQLRAEKDMRVEVEQATLAQTKALGYANQLAEENKRFGLDYITDDKARAAATLALDAEIWRKRIDLAGEGTEAQRKLQAEFDQWYKNQSIKPQLDEQKRVWGDVERTAHDTFISIFDSGKSAFDRLKDTLKNGLLELLYQMTMKKWIMNISGNVAGSGGGITSVAQAVAGGDGGSGVGSTISSLGALGSLTSGVGLLGAGGLGLQAGFGALVSGGFAGISAAVSGGIAAIGAGTGASIAAGLGTIAGALGPIALGIGAAVAIWKKLDTSGTYHAGGAASATSAGVTAVSASSLNMERIQANADTQKMVSQLAQGVVGILDSTALAFGKTAGYQAATAFADDTSKDGAWGSLVISKLGQSVVNWQDTRGNGKWSQKTFADGEKGQEQYLAALTASVRTALDSIGLPDWARTMLNGVASDASLDDLAKVVDQINKTQSALGAMRSQLAGFSNMSDAAVSALMSASGGIDKLFASASAYYDAFYTEAEKNSTVNEQIAKQLAAVNLQMPSTKEGFRAMVEAQMQLGPQGAESVSVLLGVAAAFAQLHPEVEAAAKSLEAQKSALTEAYNAEADALQATITRMGSFATTLRNVRDSALLGNLSPLSPQEKYAEAKAQYQVVLAAARNGDEGAQSNYQGAFTSFLEASRAVFASSGQYQADFAYAQAATEEAARWAAAQVDVGQAQLDSLKASVSGIIEVNKSVLSVRDALLQYQAAAAANTMPLTAVAPPVNTPIPYSSYGTSDKEPLIAEIKALRAEVSGLRAEQRQQTGDVIQAQYGAADESSDKIADSVRPVKTLEYRVAAE